MTEGQRLPELESYYEVVTIPDTLSILSVANYKISNWCRHCKECGTSKGFFISGFVVFVIILILALVLPWFFGLYPSQNNNWEVRSRQVTLLCGVVEGRRQDDIIEFLGIPYASPPINYLRMKPPVELNIFDDVCHSTIMANASSTNPYKAYNYRSSCLQYMPTNQNKQVGSDDCLYVNVFTANIQPNELRPVIVIISGVGFLYDYHGNSSAFKVTSELVNEVNAVHVTFNYRLGDAGFIVNTDNQSNFGLYDQLALLRWVKHNIEEFGGDSENVVLYGLGSGATSVLIHLSNRQSEPLFHKAWLSSPGFINSARFTKENTQIKKIDYSKYWDIFMYVYPYMFDLPDVTIDKINERQRAASIPVIDDTLIRKNYWMGLADSIDTDIPIVIGSVAEETSVFPLPATLPMWQQEELNLYIKTRLNITRLSMFDRFNELYNTKKNRSVELIYAEAVSDLRMTCPLDELAGILVKQVNRLVYRYHLSGPIHENQIDPFGFESYFRGTAHGWDNTLYFGNFGTEMIDDSTLSQMRKISILLRNSMSEFVHSKTISSMQRWDWNRITNLIGSHDTAITKQPNFKTKECKYWSRLYEEFRNITGASNIFDFAWPG